MLAANSSEEYRDETRASFGDEDNDSDTQTETQGPTSQPPLLHALSKGAKRMKDPSTYVLKRVTSRPSTAPSTTINTDGADEQEEEGSSRRSAAGFLRQSVSSASASARKVHLRQFQKPKTAAGVPIANGRRLSAFPEEDEDNLEEEAANAIAPNGKSSSTALRA